MGAYLSRHEMMVLLAAILCGAVTPRSWAFGIARSQLEQSLPPVRGAGNDTDRGGS